MDIDGCNIIFLLIFLLILILSYFPIRLSIFY